MTNLSSYRPYLEPLAKYIEDMIRARLIAGGHEATGKLSESITVEVETTINGLAIVGKSIYYGQWVDSGRKAGVKRVPLDALIAWIRVKGMDLRGRKERDVAFAIQRAIFEKGIPTDGNEDKKHWFTKPLDDKKDWIRNEIQTILQQIVQIEITEIVNKNQKKVA